MELVPHAPIKIVQHAVDQRQTLVQTVLMDFLKVMVFVCLAKTLVVTLALQQDLENVQHVKLVII